MSVAPDEVVGPGGEVVAPDDVTAARGERGEDGEEAQVTHVALLSVVSVNVVRSWGAPLKRR